jgi:hypothetical protein
MLQAAAATAFVALAAPAFAEGYRISGPHVHQNLAIYLIHGSSASGPVPLTLQEAMAKGTVRVHETGNVNELTIENLGNDEVFVQSGDIVKGGKQDRVLMVSLVLPSKSGAIPISSFCVEQGRWSQRGGEDSRTFSSSKTALPSRRAKLAMRAPTREGDGGGARPAAPVTTSERQQKVWQSVSATQQNLAGAVGRPVTSGQSRTSLQLALENDKLKEALTAYVTALRSAGERDSDVIGYVFAINGKLNSADIYPSNALFRKMWEKLLIASATEAIGEQDAAAAAAPSVEMVQAFLDAGERGATHEQDLNRTVKVETRDGDGALFFETRATGRWVHRSYLAK